MKRSFKIVFVFLAALLTLTGVQAVWAHVESIEGPYTVDGKVAYVWGDSLAIACGYTTDIELGAGCPLMVSGMGPAGWWSANDVAFPRNGSEVTIELYKVTTSVGDIKYVAGEVIDNGEGDGILLRIAVYDGDVIFVLDPAWSKMESLAESVVLLDTAEEETDCECTCTCKGQKCSCDCVCEDCADCIPVGDEHKWQGGR